MSSVSCGQLHQLRELRELSQLRQLLKLEADDSDNAGTRSIAATSVCGVAIGRRVTASCIRSDTSITSVRVCPPTLT